MKRKKQKVICVIVFGLLFAFGGCQRIDAPKGYEDYTVKKEQYVAEDTQQSDYWYAVTVEYPVLSGIEGEQTEMINKMLYDMAMEKVNYWHLTPNEEVKVIQEEYSIFSSDVHCNINFCSQYLLSVGFQEAYAPVSPVYYVHMTQRCANVNLMTGEQYQLADIFRIDDSFMELWCRQLEEDGNYADMITNDEDVREAFAAWFLGEDKEAEEFYVFTPFFLIEENKDFIIGISYDPTADKIAGDVPKDNSFFGHFAAADLEPYRTESEFWELYDRSENAGEVVECEELRENIWLGENVAYEITGKNDSNQYSDIFNQILNLPSEKKSARERILDL